MKLLRYIELKTGWGDNGPAWIGYVTASKTGRAFYFNGRALLKLKGQNRTCDGGNFVDRETGESFWISGVKKNGQDRHRCGSGKVSIEAAAVTEYLEAIGSGVLDRRRLEVTHSIIENDIERLDGLANTSYREEAPAQVDDPSR